MDHVTALLWLAPIILGVVEVAKRSGFPARHSGLLAVGLGAVGGAVLGAGPPELDVVAGVVAGLAASGLWSTGKAVAGR